MFTSKTTESTEEKSTSVLVKLRGNALNHILSLKARVMEKTGKDLGKSEAVVILLNKVPKKVIDEAIANIISNYSTEKVEKKAKSENQGE